MWVRPPWSNQIEPGVHEFQIGSWVDPLGDDRPTFSRDGDLRVTCLEPYFLSEGISVHPSELAEETVRDVALLVVDAGDEQLARTVGEFLGDAVGDGAGGGGGRLLVDVDLDYFSTRNPFLDLFPGANLYERLKALYRFDPIPKNAVGEARLTYALQSCEKRAKLLDNLKFLFE